MAEKNAESVAFFYIRERNETQAEINQRGIKSV